MLPTLLVLLVQSLDVALHIATDQFEPIRIVSNTIAAGGAISMLVAPGHARSIGLVSASIYLLLNVVFLAQNGIANPTTEALRLPLFGFVAVTIVLLVWRSRQAENIDN